MSTSRHDVENKLKAWAAEIDTLLERLLPAGGDLVAAMHYAVLGEGKRLRPYLLAESGKLFGVPRERLLHECNLGIDQALFHPEPASAPHEGARPFVVLVVGVGLRKGTPYLLEACEGLGIPDLELWLAGAVPPDLASILGRTRVRFKHLGTLSHSQLADVYRAASVFVLPSIEEGLSLSVGEAMASGLPVVVTPNTGAEDLMTHGQEGFVVPVRDPGALRRALLELYEDRGKRHAMGEAAVRATGKWTWDTYGDRAVENYTRLLASERPATSLP